MRIERSSIRQVIVSGLVVWYDFMWESVAVAVEGADVIVGLEWVGCDYHDPPVEMVQVMG
jgi:hypothetical protein